MLFDRLYPTQVPMANAIGRYVRNPTAVSWAKVIDLLNHVCGTVLRLTDMIESLGNGTLFEYRDQLRLLLLTLQSRRGLFGVWQRFGLKFATLLI